MHRWGRGLARIPYSIPQEEEYPLVTAASSALTKHVISPVYDIWPFCLQLPCSTESERLPATFDVVSRQTAKQ